MLSLAFIVSNVRATKNNRATINYMVVPIKYATLRCTVYLQFASGGLRFRIQNVTSVKHILLLLFKCVKLPATAILNVPRSTFSLTVYRVISVGCTVLGLVYNLLHQAPRITPSTELVNLDVIVSHFSCYIMM